MLSLPCQLTSVPGWGGVSGEVIMLRAHLQLLRISSRPSPTSALQLPAPGGGGAGPQVRQYSRDALAHGHHLGRGQPAEDVSAEHAGPAGGGWLGLGLLHQPQCHRLPNQVGGALNLPMEGAPVGTGVGGSWKTPSPPQASFWDPRSPDPFSSQPQPCFRGGAGE